ncbi:uncharacterized protein LOC118008876 [Mirounga leonina]|uniref:uncharacterized protein LOC118008876 n=1 Tax=Mirounga leonina TaxID=9715 RepID=UPI00156BFF7B|nr:uncharacterized protein LOC118008876 [Mirounga leonina]
MAFWGLSAVFPFLNLTSLGPCPLAWGVTSPLHGYPPHPRNQAVVCQLRRPEANPGQVRGDGLTFAGRDEKADSQLAAGAAGGPRAAQGAACKLATAPAAVTGACKRKAARGGRELLCRVCVPRRGAQAAQRVELPGAGGCGCCQWSGVGVGWLTEAGGQGWGCSGGWGLWGRQWPKEAALGAQPPGDRLIPWWGEGECSSKEPRKGRIAQGQRAWSLGGSLNMNIWGGNTFPGENRPFICKSPKSPGTMMSEPACWSRGTQGCVSREGQPTLDLSRRAPRLLPLGVKWEGAAFSLAAGNHCLGLHPALLQPG